MQSRKQSIGKVRALVLNQENYWQKISFLLFLLMVSSIGLAACGPAPAATIVESQLGALTAEISVDQAYQLYRQGATVVDVRTQEEWDDFHAPNTIHIPLDELQARMFELPEDQPIVVVCRSGNRSQVGRDILLQGGFDQVTSMAGGLKAWASAGYPTE